MKGDILLEFAALESGDSATSRRSDQCDTQAERPTPLTVPALENL